MESVLRMLAGLPPALTYLVIGAGAAIENVIPPIPADTFVLLGAFLSASGRANAWLVFVFTWVPNVASALGTYAIARKYGQGFFERPVGHWLLHPRQLEQIGKFYDRWGVFAIFGSRFLPALRAMVPVFAGVTKVSFWKVFPPLALASALWYGALIFVGATAGRNLDAILRAFDRFSTVLLVLAALIIGGFVWWWWHSRRQLHR
jgi:membrane protein DedA with SNARE-associated domain